MQNKEIVKDKDYSHHGKSQMISLIQSIESITDGSKEQEHMKHCKNESVHDEKRDNGIDRHL